MCMSRRLLLVLRCFIPGIQYSGYVDIGDGKHMHYVFAQSPGNASAKPLMLWLNGGPGMPVLRPESNECHHYDND